MTEAPLSMDESGATFCLDRVSLAGLHPAYHDCDLKPGVR